MKKRNAARAVWKPRPKKAHVTLKPTKPTPAQFRNAMLHSLMENRDPYGITRPQPAPPPVKYYSEGDPNPLTNPTELRFLPGKFVFCQKADLPEITPEELKDASKHLAEITARAIDTKLIEAVEDSRLSDEFDRWADQQERILDNAVAVEVALICYSFERWAERQVSE